MTVVSTLGEFLDEDKIHEYGVPWEQEAPKEGQISLNPA